MWRNISKPRTGEDEEQTKIYVVNVQELHEYQDAILCARILVGHMPNACSYLSTFKYYLQHQEIEWTCYIKHQQCTKQITEIKERLVSNAFTILSVQETKIDRSFPNIQFHVDDYNLFL